ncbi:hypothetical protein A8C32_14800 [Flavivirga aquatica]|uniref:Thymidylate kinase-like domain-containing protein n=1 Tax=Flavivirga aquatica TaxID=1849968 RepID=A0A1E5T8U5_9FLAO|nr:hypothetical protein [Flavivirga aquatica]OEK07758.1 hypothetical protein A8C32_14800 [Flavivirga aquatica]
MIHKLIKYLHKESIDYCIINGYKSLFDISLNNSDVDILFKNKDFLKIEDILKTFCLLENFKIVQIYHQDVYSKNIFLFNPKTNKLLNLDSYGKLQRKNTTFFSETEIFNNLFSYKGIKTLTTHHEFFHYLLKKIDKNDITDVSFNYLRSLFLKEEELCQKVLQQNFKSLSSTIIKAFQTKNKKILLDFIEALKTDIKTKSSITHNAKNKLRILKRIIKPTGIAISFLGPDGSGKSTIIDGLINKTLPYRKTAYFHLKPIINNTTNSSKVTKAPHKYKPYSKSKSYFKLLFFIYQYNLGWIKNISSLRIKSTLIIFDRYYDDLIVDYKRYRYGGSKNIAKLTRHFIPKPELYFILTADANIIYSRKQEVDYYELQTQIEDYKTLVNGKQYHYIDANKSPESIVNEVYSILMKKMHERY